MPLTADELQARQHYIGSSDIAAILGVSPYENATDVWLQKTGRVEPQHADSRTAKVGNYLERPLVDLAADALEQPVEYDIRFHRHGVLSAQCDGWMPTLERPIEAKAIGLANRRFDTSEWGAEWTDEVPYYILAQVVFSLLVSGADRGYVSALLGGGLHHRVYEIPRNDELAQLIEARALAFWRENVEADLPPENVPHLHTVTNVTREPGKRTTIDEDFADRWMALDEQYREARDARENLKAEVLHAMDDAEEAVTSIGVFTHRADKRGRRQFRFKEGW